MTISQKREPSPGDVWLCDFGNNPKVNSSIQKGERPGILLNVLPSCNPENPEEEYLAYIIVPLTKIIKKPHLPVHYIIEDWKEQGLIYRSMILGEQVFSLQRKDIKRYLTEVDHTTFENAVRVCLHACGISMEEAKTFLSEYVG